MQIIKSLVWSEWRSIPLRNAPEGITLTMTPQRQFVYIKKTLLFYFKWFQLLGRIDIFPWLYHLTDNTVTEFDYMSNTASVL